jgi:hypothetical protein
MHHNQSKLVELETMQKKKRTHKAKKEKQETCDQTNLATTETKKQQEGLESVSRGFLGVVLSRSISERNDLGRITEDDSV